jgi:hypothetical protein
VTADYAIERVDAREGTRSSVKGHERCDHHGVHIATLSGP